MEDDDAIDELVRTNRQKVSGRLTASGNGQGTPFNMSPEQVRETSDVDHRTDIYNMGIVLFEILTDESHMSGRNFREIKHKILKDPAQTPVAHAARAAISPELNAICEKALQKEPVDRYLKMSEFVDDLRAVLLGRSVSSYQPPIHCQILEWRNKKLCSAHSMIWLLPGILGCPRSSTPIADRLHSACSV